MNLRDAVLRPWVFDCRKHSLHPDAEAYAEKHVNRMDNAEFLRAISDALEEMDSKRGGKD